jgi:AbrB family looped-hinge helix DNA binding protein
MAVNDKLMATVGDTPGERHERTIGAAGRLVLPAVLREQFGLQEGTRIVMIPTAAGILLTSREVLVQQVWANNHGGDAGGRADVRAAVRTTSAREPHAAAAGHQRRHPRRAGHPPTCSVLWIAS